jgi:hypothetical protein
VPVEENTCHALKKTRVTLSLLITLLCSSLYFAYACHLQKLANRLNRNHSKVPTKPLAPPGARQRNFVELDLDGGVISPKSRGFVQPNDYIQNVAAQSRPQEQDPTQTLQQPPQLHAQLRTAQQPNKAPRHPGAVNDKVSKAASEAPVDFRIHALHKLICDCSCPMADM